ncbi:hypothetical protein B0J14DRAFT_275710 [Halenospora varia]|nr:hypothetical protein B0J14DRAFT_275710 [Halenospora varia]
MERAFFFPCLRLIVTLHLLLQNNSSDEFDVYLCAMCDGIALIFVPHWHKSLPSIPPMTRAILSVVHHTDAARFSG